MYTTDVVQIVDLYARYYKEREQKTTKIDPNAEAKSLSQTIVALGRNSDKIAIIAKDDDRRLNAYEQAGYKIQPMNGNRRDEVRHFIRQMTTQIKQTKPKYLVLVTDDPDFVHLCDDAASITELAVWTSSDPAPRELMDKNYGWRPLEDLLPDLKISRIDVRLDLENIFIGLVQRGWCPNLQELIEAIRLAVDGLGEVVTITGYADFDELDRHHGGPNINWQRAFTLAGGESRYVVNQRGKNTADMKIADDIRTLVERDHSAGTAIDIICLATMDRDFRPIADTVRRHGKKVVVLGLKGGLSHELERAASEVRYLDDFLKFSLPDQPDSVLTKPPQPSQREEAALMMRISVWMRRNHWRWVYRDRLDREFGGATETLRKLIADGWLTSSPNGSVDAQGQARMLEPNPKNSASMTAHYLASWIPARLDYCLRQMPYVDSNFLATGMARDKTLAQMGVGQTRIEVENWLDAAVSAGIVVAKKQPHPRTPTKLITTWLLPECSTPPVDKDVQTKKMDYQLTSSYLRQLLTQGLSDTDLTKLLFDNFLEVYRDVEGAPKVTRIQALLDYVERCNLNDKLMAAIHEVNPTLSGGSQLAIAA
jgi:uncharacterized LabA/DUF88 family protein